MSRNLKRENLLKLSKVNVNGFKYDIANYVGNPSMEHEYPTMKKVIEETEDTIKIVQIGYFKFYDGNGEYTKKVYEMPKGKGWHITKLLEDTVLSESRRFSRKDIEKYAEVS